MDVNTLLDILSMLNLKGRRLPLAPNSRIFNSILKALTPPQSIHAVQKGRVLLHLIINNLVTIYKVLYSSNKNYSNVSGL